MAGMSSSHSLVRLERRLLHWAVARRFERWIRMRANIARDRVGVVLPTLLVVCMVSVARSGSCAPVDVHASKLVVRVFKSGLFSALAHDHEIEAPPAGGSVRLSPPSVDLRVDTRALRVVDATQSKEKRAQIQRTMDGPQVLDVDRYREIRFHSTAIESAGPEAWSVHGILELHGRSRPIQFTVRRDNGTYRGTVALRQTEFGIRPIRIAGGTVRVKDEIRVEFEIQLAS